MATDPLIGTKIRNRRQVLGMDQQELARRLGVDRATVSNWERGKQYPQRYIGALEELLGISLGEDDGPDPEPPVNPDRDKSVEELLSEMAERTREMVELAERIRQKQRKGEADGSYRRRAG